MDMQMSKNGFATITVSLLDREDGGLRVQSDDLPGLILSGSDKDEVLSLLEPAIRALLARLGFRDFQVHPSRPLDEISSCKNPQDVHLHVQQFVVEYARAA